MLEYSIKRTHIIYIELSGVPSWIAMADIPDIELLKKYEQLKTSYPVIKNDINIRIFNELSNSLSMEIQFRMFGSFLFI